MSITRHHADWLSLVEVSGPFVSLPVLMRAFPQGLEPRDPAQAKMLRAAYDEWHDNPTAPGKQRAWVMHVLTSVLGYPENQITEGQTLPAGLEGSMPEVGEVLRPDFALVGPAGTATAGQPQLLIANYTAEQGLEKPVIGKHWKATPVTRMMELLHVANVPLGLVTNGEQWMLVYAPRGETTGYASWYGALWLDEPITLRGFHSLLGARRFFGVAADSTLLSLLKESASDQQEVTDQLGYQVREAVEVLVQSFDALDKESHRLSLKGIQPATVYDAALTIMMRLVFLFSAEERGLLHLGKPLYDNYAVSTLQEQLQEVADRYGEEVLERRYDAWTRLLATFRAVHGGVKHQDLLMQAYGGSLFDPDRYSFLEGRTAGCKWRTALSEPLAVNNRVVLHLLNSLQRLRTKTGGAAETRRLSFRALGVEQIGHVYEGLLDHTAVRATEVVLGIRGTRSKQPEIPLSTLEGLLAQGEDKLLDHLKEATGRSLLALRKELNNGNLLDDYKLLVACNHDGALMARLRPFVGLIREDSFERPWVVLPSSIYVTAGSTRRSTGTHYTPPSLTEPIVQHTLEPLVYVGPAEGLPKEQWKLKSPKEILNLKVCDMAMGSGAFLVQACRYVAERLVEAWENEEKAHPGQVLMTPDGKFSEGSPSERLVPAQAAERIAIARRVVADRCLYGVDINPMAVEMAKLSMWLITVDANRPFTFLDHAFKCGDSLLGVTSLEQLENFSLRPGGGKQQAFATFDLRHHIDEAQKNREMLEVMPSNTPEQITAKATLYVEAEEAVAKLRAAADVLVAVELKGLKGKAYEAERETAADHLMAYWAKGVNELEGFAQQKLATQRCFHWALAFPEVSVRSGFDAIIGNPPYRHGSRISTDYGSEYARYLVSQNAEVKGTSDLAVYFLRRTVQLLRDGGQLGLVTTKSIAEGDNKKSGLGWLLKSNRITIHNTLPEIEWPGVADLRVAVLHACLGAWGGARYINNSYVEGIDESLESATASKIIWALPSNSDICFKGSELLGEGFILDEGTATRLLESQANAADVVKPLVNGKEFASMPIFKPTRWVIDFGERDEVEARGYTKPFEIVEKLVKPERQNDNRPARRERYWRFGEIAKGLYEKLANCDFAIARLFTGEYWFWDYLRPGPVFTNGLVIVADAKQETFAVLTSAFHEVWAEMEASSLVTRFRYTPSRCFETFPFPSYSAQICDLGQQYHAYRGQLMMDEDQGLTLIYKRFHNPEEQAQRIAGLRQLQREVDVAVATTYGWQDLDLGHGFHETKQGIRFTISEYAKRQVLDRLLVLNHQRHAEEAAAIAAQPAAPIVKRGRKKKEPEGQVLLDL
jgi:hypothetical protein